MENEEVLEGCYISKEEHEIALLKKELENHEKRTDYRFGYERSKVTDSFIRQAEKNKQYAKHGNAIVANTIWISVLTMFVLAPYVQMVVEYNNGTIIEKVDENGTNSRQ